MAWADTPRPFPLETEPEMNLVSVVWNMGTNNHTKSNILEENTYGSA